MAFARGGEQVIGIGKTLAEKLNDFRADFIAARACRRADGGAHIHCTRAEIFAHTLKRVCNDARRRAAPSGMYRRCHARSLVAQKHRHAVSRLHAEQHVFRVRDERIATLVCFCGSIIGIAHRAYIRTVNLPASGERPITIKDIEKAAAILENVFARIN